MPLPRFLAPDHDRYHGVRPIQIYMLRTLYFLMAAFVATQAWRVILTHHGPWDHVRAVAWCVWATYPDITLFFCVRQNPIIVFFSRFDGSPLLLLCRL